MLQFAVTFDGGPFNGKVATIGLPKPDSRRIPVDGGYYELVDGPVLRALLDGANPAHLCARATFNSNQS